MSDRTDRMPSWEKDSLVESQNNDISRLEEESQQLRDEVARLRAMLLRKQVHHDPPCPLCGYNGAGFYKPSTHQCMAEEAALTPQAGKGGGNG